MLDGAKAMKLSAKDLIELEIIDEIINEPLGGAHRDKNLVLENVKMSISKNLEEFKTMTPEEIYNNRKNKFLRIGRNKGFINNLDELSSLKYKKNNFDQIRKLKKIIIPASIIILAVLISLIIFL